MIYINLCNMCFYPNDTEVRKFAIYNNVQKSDNCLLKSIYSYIFKHILCLPTL